MAILNRMDLGPSATLDNVDAGVALLKRSEQKVFSTPIQIAIPTVFLYVISSLPSKLRVTARLHYVDKTVTEQTKLRMQMDQELQGTVPSKSGRDRCIC